MPPRRNVKRGQNVAQEEESRPRSQRGSASPSGGRKRTRVTTPGSVEEVELPSVTQPSAEATMSINPSAVDDASSPLSTPASRYTEPEPLSSAFSDEQEQEDEAENGLVHSVVSAHALATEETDSVAANSSAVELLQQTRDAAQSIRERLDHSISRFKVVDGELGQLLKVRKEVQPRLKQVVQSRTPAAYTEVVTLNVGGEKFVVPKSTLLSRDAPNYFHVLFGADGQDCVAPVFTDEKKIIFLDREPTYFKHVLDYLRGYTYFNKLRVDTIRRLRVDAAYFRLPGMQAILGDPDRETELQFNKGPGVSPERNRFRVVYGVGIVGEVPLVTGRHIITYEVKIADYIGVGIISEACINTDIEFHKIADCCVYYMSGVFYTNYPYHRKEENLEKIENGDFVTQKIDMEKGYVEYVVKNSRKMVSIGRARRLRFAITMKLATRVRILPPDEVRRRLPAMHYTFDD